MRRHLQGQRLRNSAHRCAAALCCCVSASYGSTRQSRRLRAGEEGHSNCGGTYRASDCGIARIDVLLLACWLLLCIGLVWLNKAKSEAKGGGGGALELRRHLQGQRLWNSAHRCAAAGALQVAPSWGQLRADFKDRGFKDRGSRARSSKTPTTTKAPGPEAQREHTKVQRQKLQNQQVHRQSAITKYG